MIYHVAMQDETAGVIEKAGTYRHPAVARYDDRIAPDRVGQFLAIHRDHLEMVGVDMKNVVAGVSVDDRPFLDGAERNAVVDPVRVVAVAADQVSELLVFGRGRKFGLIDCQNDLVPVGDFLIADGREGGEGSVAGTRIGSGSPSMTTFASVPTGEG